MSTERLRAELLRLLLDDRAGAAAALAPRMLADPWSLTPEVRWCLLYLLRGVRCLAARRRLLEPGTLLHFVAHEVEESRQHTAAMDAVWYDVARELPGHWLRRYEDTDVRYSLDELRRLNLLLGRLWFSERNRLRAMDPPLLPHYLRRDRRRGLRRWPADA